MSRRSPNEGSVYRRGSDGLWIGSALVGHDAGGRAVRKYVSGATRREVTGKVASLTRRRDAGLVATGDRELVGVYLQRWLDDVARPTLRATTIRRNEQLIRIHAKPLGEVPIGRLTPQQLSSLYAAKLREGLSPRTVELLHAVLHRALRQAVRWQIIDRNPADAVDAPRPKRHEIRPLSEDDVRAFLAAVVGDEHEALYIVALMSGMRQGELLGLAWGDVDLTAGRIHVRRALQRLGSAWSLVEPKTARSRRAITIPPFVVAALRAHRARQLERRLAIGDAWPGHDLVFCSPFGEPIDGRHLTSRYFRAALEKAGLRRARFHDLRHTFATLHLSRGTHPKLVQEMLGHSTIALTLDVYSHVTPAMHDDAADRMERVFAGS